MVMARRITGSVALVSYLWMGALTYLYVLPGAAGIWPLDFHLLGYDMTDATAFVGALHSDARVVYTDVLQGWDRVFIFGLAGWLVSSGWRGGWMKYAVAFLAVIYAGVDLAENVAINHFLWADKLDPLVVGAASHLTMAKFAALYLCVLVLIVHRRRSV